MNAASDKSADRILYLLKTKGPCTAPFLAERLEITPMGARQHLKRLEEEGLVRRVDEPVVRRTGAGRPASAWELTSAAASRFPEGYAELTVDLLTTLRESLGPKAVERFLAARTTRMTDAYRAKIPAKASLARRVAALARLRSAEGYMAESRKEKDGAVLLIENHCPICVAAEGCQGLCASELDAFRGCLGGNAVVERIEHLLDGSRRCAYRIREDSTRR